MTTQTAKQVNTNNVQLNRYQLRMETLDGRRYLVVPVVMMVEGVHAGSDGPILHLAEELGRFPGSWDGIPVTIDHPVVDGMNVSANSPDQLKNSVGWVFRTRMDGTKLKAEAWLDQQKLMAASPQALQYIREQRPLDVSVGVFADRELVEEGSEYDGENYTAIARNHRPDHLALLPGGQGACSWTDGCGVRVNQKYKQNKENIMKKEKEEKPVNDEVTVETNEGNTDTTKPAPKEGQRVGLPETFKQLNAEGFVVNVINNTGYTELVDKLRSKLDSMDNDVRVYFLEEVFDEYFVYKVGVRETGQTRLYKQNYTTLENQEIEFVGDPEEVRRQVEYITLSMRRTKGKNAGQEISINTQKEEGGKTMSEEKEKSPCLIAKVDGLIENERTHFVEKDKEWLLSFSEDQLNKLEPIEPPQKEPEEKPADVQINREQALKALELEAMEDYIKLMPEDMQQQVEAGLAMHKQNRTTTIEAILGNTEEGVWTREKLDELPCETLEKINKSIKQPVDYSGAGAGSNPQSNQAEGEEEKLMPAGVGEKKKDK